MLSNEELLTELLAIQGQVEYCGVLEDLIDTVEKAVADEEKAAEELFTAPWTDADDDNEMPRLTVNLRKEDSWADDPSPFTVVDSFVMDAQGNRWESAGTVRKEQTMAYRDTL